MFRTSRLSQFCLTLVALGFFRVSLEAADPPLLKQAQQAPIYIQELHIDRVDNLTIIGTPGSIQSPSFLNRTDTQHKQNLSDAKVQSHEIDFAPPTFSARRDRDHPNHGQGMEIYVLDLGQADATFCVGTPDTTGNRKTLLIDVGETSPGSKNYHRVAERIKEITHQKHLDYFVATHFHSDHLGGEDNGISGLLFEEDFSIGTVIDIGAEGSAYFGSKPRPTYQAYENTMGRAVGDKVHLRHPPRFGTEQIELGPGVTVEILAFAGRVSPKDPGVLAKVAETYPGQYDDAPPSENDLSIAIEIKQGNFEFFTAGDLTGADDSQGGTRLYTERSYGKGRGETYTNVESWMVNQWTVTHAERNVEVYRVNHHGSNYSSTPELLNTLKPEFMIYSCGGRYGHPSPSVVHRGAKLDARQFVTGKLSTQSWDSVADFKAFNGDVVGGDVDIVVDQAGSWYWIQGELHKAFSDAEEAAGKDVGEAFVDRRTEVD